MQKLKFILILLLLAFQNILLGCCYGERFSITEILNNDQRNYHIFTCKIVATYIQSSDGYVSIAVVQKRYVGSPKDTIFINTGGFTTAGGEKLFPNAEWLIFSPTSDNIYYNATVCDPLSAPLKNGNNKECRRDISPFGKIYLEVLAQYETIRKEKFSGNKKIVGLGRLVAEGNFINGVPDGDWIHYSRRNEFKENIIRSKISYKRGMFDGKYDIYNESEDFNPIIQERIYKSNLPILTKNERFYNERFYVEKYKYLSDFNRKSTIIILDSLGAELRQINGIQYDFNSEKYTPIYFNDGYYFNKIVRDSSYYPLAEGYYSKGKRIGKWNFFDNKGNLSSTKTYPNKIPKSSQFQIYDDKDNLKLNGNYRKGKRLGVWKYYYDNKLTDEELYDSDGKRISKTRFYDSGGFQVTSYSDNGQISQEIVYNEDKTIQSIEKSKKSGLLTDYLANGHIINYNYQTKNKSIEGDCWNGYRTGTWIQYHDDGSYTKTYYPKDTEELMNECEGNTPTLKEDYDKENKLISSWNMKDN